MAYINEYLNKFYLNKNKKGVSERSNCPNRMVKLPKQNGQIEKTKRKKRKTKWARGRIQVDKYKQKTDATAQMQTGATPKENEKDTVCVRIRF